MRFSFFLFRVLVARPSHAAPGSKQCRDAQKRKTEANCCVSTYIFDEMTKPSLILSERLDMERRSIRFRLVHLPEAARRKQLTGVRQGRERVDRTADQPAKEPRSILRARMMEVVVRSTPSSAPI
jgi:hypothetical protein